MTLVLTLFLALSACAGEPQYCDTLCEDAGFDGIDELAEGCFCSAPSGLGGSITESACQDYCEDVGGSAEDALLETTDTTDDTCLCASEG